MKVLFLQCSNDEAVVHSTLYTKPNWSFYFRITSSKMICSIYFILSIKFKGQSSNIIATIVKDGATTFQVIDSLVTFHGHILARTGSKWPKGVSRSKGLSIFIIATIAMDDVTNLQLNEFNIVAWTGLKWPKGVCRFKGLSIGIITTMTVALKSGDPVILTPWNHTKVSIDCSALISVNSDRKYKEDDSGENMVQTYRRKKSKI